MSKSRLLRPLQLLLPALIPSWRFFDWIAPSPRIEYSVVDSPETQSDIWQEFRPRPQKIALASTLGRLLFNPRWNETLFVVSCAERLADQADKHSAEQIFYRIAADLPDARGEAFLRYRLVFLSRADSGISRETRYRSDTRRIDDLLAQ
ncbi:MAG: hypothetical protein WBD51_18230 [Burkholderiaceae bacterium]